ncbi:hypothetical protein HIM_02469 [Hirsutella minnesotensis 3608]|nr:hypothetical protein HIM_02469 [Hirsutella minnesotensis 3608]
MVSDFARLGALALALSGNAAAKRYHINETYDYTNFFDKFEFMTHGDFNNGHVKYLGLDDAREQGVAAIQGNEVFLGVENKTAYTNGEMRNSFRLESRRTHGHGLIVARFSHLPKPVCGSWPAFWTLGQGRPWPQAGEIDIYEGSNEASINKPVLHVGNSNSFGKCVLDGANQTSALHTAVNCDNTYSNQPLQWPNEGCVAKEEKNGIWGSEQGGTQALEWTSDSIKIYTFPRGAEPSNIDDDEPDTDSWGVPSVHAKKSHCDIDRAFLEQKIIINVAICGTLVDDYFWEGFVGTSGKTCRNITGTNCRDHISRHPEAFDDVYFKVRDIRYFAPAALKSDDRARNGTMNNASSRNATDLFGNQSQSTQLPCTKIKDLSYEFKLADNSWAGTWDAVSLQFGNGKMITIGEDISRGFTKTDAVNLEDVFGSKTIDIQKISEVSLFDSHGSGNWFTRKFFKGDGWLFQGISLSATCADEPGKIEMTKFQSENKWLKHEGSDGKVWASKISLQDWHKAA